MYELINAIQVINNIRMDYIKSKTSSSKHNIIQLINKVKDETYNNILARNNKLLLTNDGHDPELDCLTDEERMLYELQALKGMMKCLSMFQTLVLEEVSLAYKCLSTQHSVFLMKYIGV